MLFSQIATILDAEILQSGEDSEISHLGFDSRKISSGANMLFFALIGENKDGHQYIFQAYEKGVRNFVVSEAIDTSTLTRSNVLKVDNSLIALQKLAGYHRKKFNLPVTAITGSNGKTMVKEWLSDLLSEKLRVVKSPKSYNSQIGVPLSVWQISSLDEIGVFEAGVSKPGEMQNLRDILLPSLGIFTNIGPAHDEGFESWEQKIEEKAVLFENCQSIICCRDQDFLYQQLKSKFSERLISWSTEDQSAKLFFQRVEQGFQCKFKGQNYCFKIQISGGFYLENLLHAITAAILSGLSEAQINSGIERIKPVPMRLELKRGIHDCYILDDTYNNDLAGLSIALDYLKQQPQKKRKTVILSDIKQSGENENTLYEQVSELLLQHQITRFIGIGEALTRHNTLFGSGSQFYASTNQFLKELPAFSNEMILIKGARDFTLEKIVELLEEQNHGTVLEVNFENLTHNLNRYRTMLSAKTRLMVMVKAFAYGGGLSEIAHLLQFQKVDYLGVAYTDEGVTLRQNGITLPIMVMNPDWSHFGILETFDLQPEIYSLRMLQTYVDTCANPSPIHLKIETGMNRLGFREAEIEELIEFIAVHPEIRIAGIFTHFAGAEEVTHDDFTKKQADTFARLADKITQKIKDKPVLHALNSAGIYRWSQFHFDLVRLGIGLYGHDSSGQISDLKPISTLKTRISQIREIRKGETVGYSRKGVAEQNGQIAIVPIGYADGYLRKFGNANAYMLVNGQKAPTIGNVCMDMTMLDVTGLEVSEGDEVTVFGPDPNIEKLAEWAETIPYEILTNVSQRVKRVFVSE